jgi:sulfite reductase beta subunit-like hemoprotein
VRGPYDDGNIVVDRRKRPVRTVARMAAPDLPAAKRAGLPVDLERLTRDGDDWLSPEERYALKTHGVCAQEQEHVFMVRVRIPGGVLPTFAARGLARLARAFGPDWLHLTTRQNVELHWVEDRRVPELLVEIERLGLTTRSACGHTMRNVMCSEDAGLGLDEPFDCLPDARLVSDTLLARSATLNVTLPSRINIAFGGSPRCRADALLNVAAFVSTVVDGVAGYEVWAGGSLGRAPTLAVRLSELVPRHDALPAAEAIVDVFVAHGDFDRPAKGRLKVVLDALGETAFRAAWDQAFAEAIERVRPAAVDVEVLADADRVAILAQSPPGGWSVGVRPQRTPGRALLTIDVPMGDTNGSELEVLADLADRYADGFLVLSRDQNVVLRNVALGDIPAIRDALRRRGLFLGGEAHTPAIRACTGSSVCALGITTAPETARTLVTNPSLGRSSSLRVHVSGCPNSCAQHQIGDIGLAGSKVRVGGVTRDGYHVFVGSDLDRRLVGEVIGRVAADDVDAAVQALVGAWESLRHEGETLGVTARRIGLDALTAHLSTVMADRWAEGPEPVGDPIPTP